jgi:hypothetical protein
MSTYSTNLKLELLTTGTQAGTWGDTTNTNLGTLLEQAISGYVLQACTGGTDVITIPDGATGVARNMYLQLTGTGGGTLVVPVNKKLYFIYNATSTAITVKVTGLTGVSVPAGAKTILVSNGTDIIDATNYMSALSLGAALPVTSGGTGVTTSTGSGANVLGTSPTIATPSISSPTLTGTPVAPTASSGTNTTQIATTQFVTSAVSTATGSLGTMSTQNANNVAITGGTIASVAITGGTISGLSSPLPLASGGTGGTTSTGSGAIVLASSATLSSPTINSPTFGGTPTMGASFITRMSAGGVSASGNTSVAFTGMPSWINAITVMFSNISTNGSSFLLVQLGTSGGFATSGYVSTCNDLDGDGGSSTSDSTTGLIMRLQSPAGVINGLMNIAYMGSNVWAASVTCASTTRVVFMGGGTCSLGGTLDRIRITTVNGTDAFDAGTLNVSYQ